MLRLASKPDEREKMIARWVKIYQDYEHYLASRRRKMKLVGRGRRIGSVSVSIEKDSYQLTEFFEDGSTRVYKTIQGSGLQEEIAEET